MNTIYQETVRAVDNGAKFKIDFRRRSLKINGTYIIRDGKCDRELGVPPSTEDEFFAKMEELYRRYKHSVPSERSESKPCRYFKALKALFKILATILIWPFHMIFQILNRR